MSLVYLALPVALFIAALAVGAWWWAVKSGQFDDLETPRHRALWEDDAVAEDADEIGADGKPTSRNRE
ncbi:MAG: cbb3-type cytochrome oxidase assembly protein CcoS [Planctomycetota bacterium]|nr:cbb3-type cytochrome oxidase assembly protein CcoS [Planctomycetota bacterium]